MTKDDKKQIVAVGMSGGLDSTMAALFLKKQGYAVFGVTMKIWDNSLQIKSHKSGCYGPGELEDIEFTKKMAKKLGIKHYVVDLSKEYKEEILNYFREEYLNGRTPNPCVFCNANIKFGYLLKKILESGIEFDYFATGHYARVEFDPKSNSNVLKKGLDKSKDQSYFLYRLKQEQLRKIIFPLGEYQKNDVRQMAIKEGFDELAKKDESQDFFECDDYAAILGEDKPGEIVDWQGKKVGEHNGIWHFTRGQRKNLHLSGLKEPYYVIRIEAGKNRVIVGPKNLLEEKKIVIDNTSWITPPREKIKDVEVKIRYGSEGAKCNVEIKGDEAEVNFREPQIAPAPGQSAVIYSGDSVLGGGIIR